MGGYPTGPPTCGGPKDPHCKVWITSMSQTAPLVVFGCWIFVFVVIVAFQLYRAAYLRKHSYPPVVRGGPDGENRGEKTARSAATTPNGKNSAAATQSVIEVAESEVPLLRFTGYRTVLAGEFCWWLLILISLHWIAIYVLVLIDAYWKCQMTSIDNTCFYGTYFVFGNYPRNATVFFAIWWIMLFWFTALVIIKRELHNWFRIPCELSRAHVVHVWAQDQQEVLSVNASPVVLLVRKLKDYYSTFLPDRKGHAETVVVKKTELGTAYILFQGQRYLIAKDGSLHLARFGVGQTYADFFKLSGGLTSQEAEARYDQLGPNEVPFKPESLWVSIAEEMFTFFKVYQFLVYAVWLWFSYLFVGGVLLSVVLIAAAITIINRRRAQFAIAKLTEYESLVEVKRDGTWRNVDYRNLVPGDVVKIQNDWKLPCDLLIIQGVCVCNESNLTGEAMPEQKYKAGDDDVVYDADGHKGARHTLFSGTQVLQAGGGSGSSTDVVAVVTATGMSTSKGRLLSSILFPEKLVFKYDEELPIVVGMLLIFALILFGIALYFQTRTGQKSIWVTKWGYCINLISQVLSPLLPVALEIGQIYADVRLKNRGIFCLNTRRIAIAGKIRVFCFDKTGTLTNNGLDFVGVKGVENTTHDGLQFRSTEYPWKHDLIDDVILRGFATCHAVTKFGTQFLGNEVEVKMFSSVGWDLAEEGAAEQQYPTVFNKTGDVLTIVRRNEFEHARATMSVVVQDQTGELHVYCKGSFEKIQDLSTPASLPPDYLQTAKACALDGCYVLSLSYKSLGKGVSLDAVKALSREDLERDLTFISLLLFRNELKPDTRDAIEHLREGEVRPVMITGDNAQCGFYIAKECSMVTEHVDVLLAEINREGSVVWQSMTSKVPGSIDEALPTIDMWDVHQKRLEDGLTELAVTGKAFDELFRNGRMKDLLLFTRIYARCTPENKVQVINMHRDAGFVVGMCGDGGNDCGALRSAHVGLALSEAEASVVSPFTSKLKTVSSTVELVREGRAALHTSFASFKFLIMYGLSYSIFRMAQNWFGTVACQLDYIFIDGVSVLSLGYAMNLSNPVKKLRKERPTSSLLGPEQLASVLGIYIISLLFIIGELSFMSNQSDYVKWPASFSQGAAWWTLGDNWESTIIAFGIFSQFIATAVIFSFGSQFRRPVYRNYFLIVAWAAIFTAISLALLLPHSSFTHLWHVASEQFNQPNATSPVWKAYQEGGGAPSAAMSFSFRLRFWFLILANIATIALWQKFVVDGPVARYARKKLPNTQKLHL